MNQELKSDTPETDAWINEQNDKGYSVWSESVRLARKLERERNEARRMWSIYQDEMLELSEQIRLTIMENPHLADGEICTLKRLKDAIGFDMEDKP